MTDPTGTGDPQHTAPRGDSYITMLVASHYIAAEPDDRYGFAAEAQALDAEARQLGVRIAVVDAWRRADRARAAADGPDGCVDAYIRSLLERHGIAAGGRLGRDLADAAIAAECRHLVTRAETLRDWCAAALAETTRRTGEAGPP